MPVKSQKLLGVYIGEHLNWTPHIDHLCAIISSRILLLKQVAQCVPENIQKLSIKVILSPLLIMVKILGEQGERGGSVVECRTPEREVGGSKPTAAVLCP